jgi:sugar/nucleoside kinase (ribokinase family)
VDPAPDTSTKRRPLGALVLGGVAWNTMVYLDEFPSPHPQTVFARGSHQTIGSSGAGKALNLSSLGFDTTLWALVGDDEPGTRIRLRLTAEGITFFGQPDPRGTARHVNLMDGSGERISIFANPGSSDSAADTELVADRIAAADLVAVTILDHCRAFLPLLAGRPVWCDIHDYDGANPYHREFIEAADYLFLSSVNLPDYRRFMEARVDAGARAVVCTHGADGASGLDAGGTWIDIEAAPVKRLVDSNGAGDAFFAGFALSWLRDQGLATAMESGTIMAAAAVASKELAPGAGDVPAHFGR